MAVSDQTSKAYCSFMASITSAKLIDYSNATDPTMADPQFKEQLDHWDITTVILYRSGLSLAAVSLLPPAILPAYVSLAHWLMLLAVALCCFAVHIYDKNIRLIIQGCGWLSLLLMLAAQNWPMPWFELLSIGAAYLVFGALCFKESFCFRIPFLRAMPAVFALTWVILATGWTSAHRLLLVVIVLAMAIMAVAKWRMPLHFDIGDKRNYQL